MFFEILEVVDQSNLNLLAHCSTPAWCAVCCCVLRAHVYCVGCVCVKCVWGACDGRMCMWYGVCVNFCQKISLHLLSYDFCCLLSAVCLLVFCFVYVGLDFFVFCFLPYVFLWLVLLFVFCLLFFVFFTRCLPFVLRSIVCVVVLVFLSVRAVQCGSVVAC